MSKSSEEFSSDLKKIILDTAYYAGAKSAHLGGALSIVDVISVLYGDSFIKIEQTKINKRQNFILSKGHACLAYYALLYKLKFITNEDLKSFESDGSILLGHPVLNIKKGIEFSTGSLGMGFSIAVGQALAAKKRNENNKIFVVLGDGETNEGSVWEAAMSAPNFKLDNLTVIVDKNNFQQTGSTNEIMKNENLQKKFESFGWHVSNVDGHNHGELKQAFGLNKNLPKAVIANTIKGKGFSFSENNNEWHHSILTKSIYEEALMELKKDGY